ncbi:GntR family transcriptional regulator [bacterium]|nr:MAG: GntR family transcriptional regulator [bacterium]
MARPGGLRWEEIHRDLMARIESGELPAGARVPSETDLALTYSVSRMTVHQAMKQLQEGGYVVRRPKIGTVVAGKAGSRRHRVALLMSDIHLQPHANYLLGLSEGLGNEAEITLLDPRGDPAQEAHVLRSLDRSHEAVAIYPTCAPSNTPLLQAVRDRGVPVLCLDRVPEGLVSDSVATDNYGSCRQVLDRLTAKGHRRMLMISQGSEAISSVADRRRAFVDSLSAVGVDGRSAIRSLPNAVHWDFAEYVNAVHDTLFVAGAQAEPPTVIFAQQDWTLSAVLHAAERLRWRVPEDLQIVAVNDDPNLPILGLDRTHRIQPASFQLGRRAAEILLRRMRGDRSPALEVRLPAEIVSAEEPLLVRT